MTPEFFTNQSSLLLTGSEYARPFIDSYSHYYVHDSIIKTADTKVGQYCDYCSIVYHDAWIPIFSLQKKQQQQQQQHVSYSQAQRTPPECICFSLDSSTCQHVIEKEQASVLLCDVPFLFEQCMSKNGRMSTENVLELLHKSRTKESAIPPRFPQHLVIPLFTVPPASPAGCENVVDYLRLFTMIMVRFIFQKQQGLYQNKVNYSLTTRQKLNNYAQKYWLYILCLWGSLCFAFLVQRFLHFQNHQQNTQWKLNEN